MLFVVIEDLFDALDTRVGITFVGAVVGLVLLVPVQDTPDEGRDESDTSFGAGNCLAEAKEESKVAVDVFVLFEFTSGLNAFPRRCDLDENTLSRDTDGFVERNQLLCLVNKDGTSLWDQKATKVILILLLWCLLYRKRDGHQLRLRHDQEWSSIFLFQIRPTNWQFWVLNKTTRRCHGLTRRSTANSACWLMSEDFSFAYLTAASTRWEYCGLFAAARRRLNAKIAK